MSDDSINDAIDASEKINFGSGNEKLAWMDEPRHVKLFKSIEEDITKSLPKIVDKSGRTVLDSVFDHSTLLAIYKLMQDGHIVNLDHPIARGKEAHVYHGTGPEGSIAVKIFNTTNAVFKHLIQYIEGDPRFGGLKRKKRDLVTIWVRKEFRNLIRMQKAGVRVPKPIASQKNVLIMEFIGENKIPAPQLRTSNITNPKEIIFEVIDMIRNIWQKGKIAHADISEYNILIHQKQPWIIDVGQGVSNRHPRAEEFLVRDIERIQNWAKRQGVQIPLEEYVLHVIDEDEMEWEYD